jgi:hypothetical protein
VVWPCLTIKYWGVLPKFVPFPPPSTKSCMVGLLGVEPPIYAVCNLSRGLLALRNFRKPISLRVTILENCGSMPLLVGSWKCSQCHFGIVFASNHDF